MKVSSRKSKMVSFRLSPEEFRLFRLACEERGVRSVSELARTAMQSMLTTNGTAHPDQIQQLRDRVRTLTADIERLAERVEPSANGQAAVASE